MTHTKKLLTTDRISDIFLDRLIVCCWKNVEKNVSMFMERFDGSLYSWVIVSICIRIANVGYKVVIIYCAVAIVYCIISLYDSVLPLWWIKMNIIMPYCEPMAINELRLQLFNCGLAWNVGKTRCNRKETRYGAKCQTSS